MMKTHLIPHVARRFKALGEPARLELVAALQAGERSVSELVDLTGRGQPNVSQHLGGLVNAGLVDSRRDGARVFYRLKDPMVLEICSTICRSVERAAALALPIGDGQRERRRKSANGATSKRPAKGRAKRTGKRMTDEGEVERA
jgi:DNA-binding transcriptional ArsR family regulator